MNFKRKELFWDVDFITIDRILEVSDSWAILRVVEYGSLKDIWELIDFYGEERIKEVLLKEDLKPMSRAMAFLYLGIDKDNRYSV